MFRVHPWPGVRVCPFSNPKRQPPREAFPAWARELSEKYYSRTISMFVLHGNTGRACAVRAIARTIFVVLRAVAIQVCLTVLAAFCDAPSQHFHVHDYTEHVNRDHGAALATRHGHFGFRAHGGHESVHQLCAEDGDNDAIFLNWFQDQPNPQSALVFETAESPVLRAPAPTRSRVGVLTCRSHDPPSLRSRNSRAPPSTSVPRGVLNHAV